MGAAFFSLLLPTHQAVLHLLHTQNNKKSSSLLLAKSKQQQLLPWHLYLLSTRAADPSPSPSESATECSITICEEPGERKMVSQPGSSLIPLCLSKEPTLVQWRATEFLLTYWRECSVLFRSFDFDPSPGFLYTHGKDVIVSSKLLSRFSTDMHSWKCYLKPTRHFGTVEWYKSLDVVKTCAIQHRLFCSNSRNTKRNPSFQHYVLMTLVTLTRY